MSQLGLPDPHACPPGTAVGVRWDVSDPQLRGPQRGVAILPLPPGTCTNDQKDDCRLPGGTTVTSCSDMSRYWKVTTPEQPSCQGPPPEPWVRPSRPPVSCPPSPICELILSE